MSAPRSPLSRKGSSLEPFGVTQASDAKRSVTVRVPGTSANLGSGFDCIGMAVDVWNTLTVERATSFSLMIKGEGADKIPKTKENFVVVGVEMVFKKFGVKVPPLAYFCDNGIPFGSGLGSSSAAIVSGLLAGLVLIGKELPVIGQETLLQMAAEVEGHVDNIAPCIYGGIQLGIMDKDRWTSTSVSTPVNNLECIVFTPNASMSTSEARGMLPDTIPRKDAVYNMGRLALLVHSLSEGNWDSLRLATEDCLHQPIRGSESVMPWLFPVVNAALEAGAKGAFLSGAGSSIMALSVGLKGDRIAQSQGERKDAAIAKAMTEAAAALEVQGTLRVTKTSALGAHVVSYTAMERSAPSMRYRSSRDPVGEPKTFESVVMQGLASDGGLYVPETIPKISPETLESWKNCSYTEMAFNVMNLYIGPDEIPRAALKALIDRTYTSFSTKHVVPLVEFTDSLCVMEQFHGPTCAFKDVALQFLGNLFEHFLENENAKRESAGEPAKSITVMGATSGDTGSAAIQGLRGKKNIEVVILFPTGRVADIQEAQMTTVLDKNINCVSVEGTFDDCQTMVKQSFSDTSFNGAKVDLAAVNSINWARILAQIVYYFYGYFRWLELGDGSRKCGDKVTYVVPSGNFGNALAGFYARSMGLPIAKLAVSTNENDILHRFFSDGDYSARTCVPTLAPAMDITKASNFERFLFHLLGNDGEALRACMDGIGKTGSLDLGPNRDKLMQVVREIFVSDRASDDQIARITAKYKAELNYAPCPHAAVGLHVAEKNLLPAGHSVICMATAHPGKFAGYDNNPIYRPACPPQLQGLLAKPTRVKLMKKDLRAVQNFVLAQATRAAEVAEATRTKKRTYVPMVGAWLFGVAVGVVLLPLVKSLTSK